jgi:DNA-binding transcriptional ArsR family regulator
MPNENPSAQPAETGTGTETGTRAKLPIRRVADATTLRALSHPLRIELLEALGMHGTMTATEVGEIVGESPTTCSFHLRQLAKYGFVEEAGGGKGRARPWRMASEGLHLTTTPGDTESELAAEALGRLIADRQASRYRTWRDTRLSYPEEWVRAATNAEYLIYLTAAELRQLNDDIGKLIENRFGHRYFRPEESPPGSLPVEIQLTDYPVAPPSSYLPNQTTATAEQPAADQEGE